jgi:hypothetical protein
MLTEGCLGCPERPRQQPADERHGDAVWQIAAMFAVTGLLRSTLVAPSTRNPDLAVPATGLSRTALVL